MSVCFIVTPEFSLLGFVTDKVSVRGRNVKANSMCSLAQRCLPFPIIEPCVVMSVHWNRPVASRHICFDQRDVRARGTAAWPATIVYTPSQWLNKPRTHTVCK